jgi:hypothetical protein
MDHRAEAWYRRRTSHWRDWPVGQLLADKQRRGARISVVIPARNEERTVAGVVGPLHRAPVAELLAVAARRRSGPHRQVPGLALEQFDREDGQVRRRTRPVPTDERPPAGTVLAGPVGPVGPVVWPSMHNAAP